MKKDKVREKFLEELERTPIIQHACERCGISRNTFYRWTKEDHDFALAVEERMSMGVDLVSDVAEGNVLNGIKKGDAGYTKYWLSSRHPSYRRPFIFHKSPVNEEQESRRREDAKKRAAKMLAMFGVPVIEDKPSPPSGKRPSRRR